MVFRIVRTLNGRFCDTVINEGAVDCDVDSSSGSVINWLGFTSGHLLLNGDSHTFFIYFMIFYEKNDIVNIKSFFKSL